MNPVEKYLLTYCQPGVNSVEIKAKVWLQMWINFLNYSKLEPKDNFSRFNQFELWWDILKFKKGFSLMGPFGRVHFRCEETNDFFKNMHLYYGPKD